MIDLTEQLKKDGGDPACFHCQLSALINLWLEERAEPIHAMKLATSLGEIVGDLLMPCPAEKLDACFEFIAKQMAGRCGLSIHKLDTTVVRAAAPASAVKH